MRGAKDFITGGGFNVAACEELLLTAYGLRPLELGKDSKKSRSMGFYKIDDEI